MNPHYKYDIITIKTGWWFGTFLFCHMLGMSSSQLTNIFRGVETTNQKITIFHPGHSSFHHFLKRARGFDDKKLLVSLGCCGAEADWPTRTTRHIGDVVSMGKCY